MVRVGVVVTVAVLSAALIAINKSEILLRLSEARVYGSAWWPQRVAKHKGLLIYGCRPNLTGASLCEGWKGVQVQQHRKKKGGGVSDTRSPHQCQTIANKVFHYNKGTIHFKISQQEALPLPPLRRFSDDQRTWSEMRIYVHMYATLSMLFSELPQLVTLKWMKVLFLNKPRTSRLVSMPLPSASGPERKQ